MDSSQSGSTLTSNGGGNVNVKLTPISLKLPIGNNANAPSVSTISTPPTLAKNNQLSAVEDDSNGALVMITILPDDQGRFGFNVKGGIDQKMPIIVSRVGANTPADK